MYHGNLARIRLQPAQGSNDFSREDVERPVKRVGA